MPPVLRWNRRNGLRRTRGRTRPPAGRSRRRSDRRHSRQKDVEPMISAARWTWLTRRAASQACYRRWRDTPRAALRVARKAESRVVVARRRRNLRVVHHGSSPESPRLHHEETPNPLIRTLPGLGCQSALLSRADDPRGWTPSGTTSSAPSNYPTNRRISNPGQAGRSPPPDGGRAPPAPPNRLQGRDADPVDEYRRRCRRRLG